MTSQFQAPFVLAAAVAAVALSPVLHRLARSGSRWLGSGLHVLLAGLGAWLAWVAADSLTEAVTFGLLAIGAGLLVTIDLAEHRLPDPVVGAVAVVLIAGLAVSAWATGDWGSFGRAVAAGIVALLTYFALAWVNPAGLGLGDVKLAGVLGVLLGWFGWPAVLTGFLAASVLGGLAALALLATRAAGLKTSIPYGPWLVLGTALAVRLAA